MLIPIIIAIEKDKHKVMNLFIKLFLILKNMTRLPNIVDIPAIVDSNKEYITDILSP